VVWAAELVRARVQMHQGRRMAVAADADERSSASGTAVAGDGSGDIVGRECGERDGGRGRLGWGGGAGLARASGGGRSDAAAPNAVVSAGVVVAAGARVAWSCSAAAQAPGARTLAGYP